MKHALDIPGFEKLGPARVEFCNELPADSYNAWLTDFLAKACGEMVARIELGHIKQAKALRRQLLEKMEGIVCPPPSLN